MPVGEIGKLLGIFANGEADRWNGVVEGIARHKKAETDLFSRIDELTGGKPAPTEIFRPQRSGQPAKPK